MPVIIALANQKGGVGKTTTAVNLGAALAAEGKAVVVIDIDPQANATTSLGINPLAVPYNTYDLLTDPHLALADVLLPTEYGVRLVPSHINLSLAERDIDRMLNRERVLRRRLEGLPDDVDVALIDCPPTLGILTINALTAANAVLVPLQCELLAVEGLSALLNTVTLVQSELNPALRLLGILLTMHDPEAATSREIVDRIRQAYGARVFQTTIPRYKKLGLMATAGPIRSYAPAHPATALYQQLAQEVMHRAR